MGRFQGRTALVTGGASGIGEATARLLAAERADVVIADLDDARGAELADEIGAVFVHLDVSDAAAMAAVVADYAFDLGVLNAGVGARFEDLRSMDDDIYHRVMDVNVGGVVVGTRELFRSMAGRGGAISVTASLAGLDAHTQSPLYGASKWAVVGWIKAIAPHLSDSGVRINGVCPGLVDTPILGPGGGDLMRQMGLKVLEPSAVAHAHATSLTHEGTGELFTVQHGRPVQVHVFNPVEGYQR